VASTGSVWASSRGNLDVPEPKGHIVGSGAGFSVERVGFNKLAYREGNKQTTCTIEHYGKGPILGVVYLAEGSDSWDPPFDTARVSDAEWTRVGHNIREAYRAQGFEVDIYFSPAAYRLNLWELGDSWMSVQWFSPSGLAIMIPLWPLDERMEGKRMES
jgi:hypothetical protein